MAKSLKRSSVIILSSVLSALAIGTFAWASIPGTNGSINGCYKNSNPNKGELIVIDSLESCPNGYTSLNWQQYPRTQQFSEVVQFSVTESNKYSLVAQKTCSSGLFATGGGADLQVDDPNQFFLKKSQPLLDSGVPVGWKVTYGYLGSLPAPTFDVGVFVICTVGS